MGVKRNLKVHFLSPEEIEAAVPQVIYATESTDPMKVAIGLPLYIAAKTAREGGKRVLLTGQGADELFGGYSRHEGFLSRDLMCLIRRFILTLRTSQQSTLKEMIWLQWPIPWNSGCLFLIKK
nr:asparagine synthase-related protein [Methanosarcina horonobensis]